MDNIIYEIDQHVIASGKGKNKKEAFAKENNKKASKVISNESDLIFKIETKTFKVQEFNEINKKEHFLFFFFLRICKSCEVIIDALVHTQSVAIKKINCKKIEVDGDFLKNAIKGI